jgi:hypothetical protein
MSLYLQLGDARNICTRRYPSSHPRLHWSGKDRWWCIIL